MIEQRTYSVHVLYPARIARQYTVQAPPGAFATLDLYPKPVRWHFRSSRLFVGYVGKRPVIRVEDVTK